MFAGGPGFKSDWSSVLLDILGYWPVEGMEDCSGMYRKMEHKSEGMGYVNSSAQRTTNAFIFQCLQSS